jgi:hypothetical protein
VTPTCDQLTAIGANADRCEVMIIVDSRLASAVWGHWQQLRQGMRVRTIRF